MSISLDGGENCTADLSLVCSKRGRLPKPLLCTGGGDAIRPQASSPDRIAYKVPANGRIVLTW